MVSKEMEDTGFVSFNEALCFACYFCIQTNCDYMF